MKKFTFKMSPEGYYKAVCLRDRKKPISMPTVIISVIFILTSIVYAVATKAFLTLVFLIISVIIFTVFFKTMKKKAITGSFSSSPILSGEHTITIYTQGIEIINSFEKYYYPWESVALVKDTPEYFIIITDYQKGAFAVSKAYLGNSAGAFNDVLNAIKANMKVEGV